MQRVRRAALAPDLHTYLNDKQQEIDTARARGENPDITSKWKSARQTQSMTSVLNALQSMMGKRGRCMYCVDSHGCDIEHFRPKSPFPEWMFQWQNLLLCCTECGRLKGSKFPLHDDQQPLLIDPCVEDPWDYLDFEIETGRMSARYILQLNDYSNKGLKTVEILQLDRREGLAESYKRTYKRLKQCISNYLETPSATQDDLVDHLLEADDHGLLGWCFKGTGQNEAPFSALKSQQPDAWQHCLTAFSDY
ncbi:MAG: TIGR02646 family protein [Gallionella sp.]|nr:TIGR02646 family protein [Gallionella sp.]MDD4957867.1 TIGR02646 family protein [Gallionella sp.]